MTEIERERWGKGREKKRERERETKFTISLLYLREPEAKPSELFKLFLWESPREMPPSNPGYATNKLTFSEVEN